MIATYKFRTSSALESIEHDGIALATVRFVDNPSNAYQYYPVTGAQVKRVADARSVGRMFHEEIQDAPEITMIRKITG